MEPDFSKFRDVLGQMDMLKTYTHIVLGFPVARDDAREAIVEELKRASAVMVAAFPWMAGHVVHEGAGPGNSGLATIVPYKSGERSTLVVVKDCSELCPSFDDILKAGGPMSMLDGRVVAPPWGGMPSKYGEEDLPAPVTAIQANFVRGGLLLAFACQHNIMDMNAQGVMIQLLAKALRGEAYTKLELEHGNRDKRDAIRLLSPEEMVDVSRYRSSPSPPPSDAAQQPDEQPEPAKWVYFHFPGARIAQLKATTPPSSTGVWVSTDDVLSALVLQRTLAARIKRLGSGSAGATGTLARALNARPYLETPLPRGYLGHGVWTLLRDEALDDPATTDDVSKLARSLRQDLQDFDWRWVHSFATALAAEPDKSKLALSAGLDMSRYDLVISSWLKLGLYQTDFGPILGGRPVLAKRQNFAPFGGLLYLMPQKDDKSVDVAFCLQAADIEALKADQKFMAYAEYVG